MDRVIEEPQNIIRFSFKDLETDQSTFLSRAMTQLRVTNPFIWFRTNEQVLRGVELVKEYKQKAAQAPNGIIYITPAERKEIQRGYDLWNGHCDESGELVNRVFRICGNVPVNLVTIGFVVLAPPTMKWTAFS